MPTGVSQPGTFGKSYDRKKFPKLAISPIKINCSCFPENSAKFFGTAIAWCICKRLLLDGRKVVCIVELKLTM